MLPEITNRMVSTNNIRLHIVEAGPVDGPLVVLLHGYPEFWYGWRGQILDLAEAGFRVVVPDQRGYNESDKPQGLRSYRLDVLAQDVVGLVGALGYQKARLVGHDWGGIVAWWTALHFGMLVERLAVLNAPHPAVMRRNLMRNPLQMVRSLYAAFFQIPGLPEAILRSNNWEPLVEGMRRSSRPGTFSDNDMVHYRQAWWRRGAMTAMLNWYRANAQLPPQIPSNPLIHPPALVLWGAQDFALGREMVEPSVDLCYDGQFVIFNNASHWIQHEEPRRVNTLLIDFLPG